MPKYSPLPVNYDFNQAHNNSVFKHEFRSKAAAVAYFDGLGGAGTLTFTGTEGVDYEFNSNHGFHVISTTGQAMILISNIMTDTTLQRYFANGGFSFEYECQTSQWISPAYTPATWLTPPPHLAGGFVLPAGSGVLYWLVSSTVSSPYIFAAPNDTTTGGTHNYGRNRIEINPGFNAANNVLLAGVMSNDEKGPYFKHRVSITQGCLSGWTDNFPMIAPIAGANPATQGERRCFRFNSLQTVTDHDSGTLTLVLNNNNSTNGCLKYIRNIRLFNAPTTMNVHPMLSRVCSFGDSYSATLLGPMGVDVSPAGVSIGTGGLSAYSEDYANGAELGGGSVFAKKMIANGYGVGGCYGGGQGGKAFASTLDSEGWRNQFVTFNHPTLVFTAGMHNDSGHLVIGGMTLAGTGAQNITALQNAIMAQYILPVMQRGCYGWGFMVMPVSQLNIDSGYQSGHNQIETMLLGLPAAWNAAYPQYVGKVKVKDLRTTIGAFSTSNKNWKGMFFAGELTHLSQYGLQLCAKASADMALEWLRGA